MTGSESTDKGDSILKERLLRIATQMFANRGYGATSIREIVERANCTKPALYYHFGSKEGLYRAIIEAESKAIVDVILTMTAEAGPLPVRIHKGMLQYFEHVSSNPTSAAVLLRAYNQREHGQPEVDFVGLRRTHLSMFQAMLADGVKTGEVASNIDLEEATAMLSAVVEVAMMRLVFEDETISPQRLKTMTQLFFKGVEPR
jgi:TetR/AcrR family transcriptional regulator